ncbi:MAG: histidine phosphatase family protein, partial [Christensenellaceae bacterium]|nr:histidine phosphatase family protein [Christensenellaceae bacterium]
MGKLYLLRHGETDLTLKRAFCGVFDPPLNDKGKETA